MSAQLNALFIGADTDRIQILSILQAAIKNHIPLNLVSPLSEPGQYYNLPIPLKIISTQGWQSEFGHFPNGLIITEKENHIDNILVDPRATRFFENTLKQGGFLFTTGQTRRRLFSLKYFYTHHHSQMVELNKFISHSTNAQVRSLNHKKSQFTCESSIICTD